MPRSSNACFIVTASPSRAYRAAVASKSGTAIPIWSSLPATIASLLHGVLEQEVIVVDGGEKELLARESLADGQVAALEPLVPIGRVAQEEGQHGPVVAHHGAQQRDVRVLLPVHGQQHLPPSQLQEVGLAVLQLRLPALRPLVLLDNPVVPIAPNLIHHLRRQLRQPHAPTLPHRRRVIVSRGPGGPPYSIRPFQIPHDTCLHSWWQTPYAG